jgi:hypothetical protein
VVAMTSISRTGVDLFTDEALSDPYALYRQLRRQDSPDRDEPARVICFARATEIQRCWRGVVPPEDPPRISGHESPGVSLGT